MNSLGLSPAELMDIARRVCTDKQLQVIQLRESGMGWKRASLVLGVGPDTVRDHHRAAIRKITKEVERVEAARGGATCETGERAREDRGGSTP